jgi:hypothetical protein
MDDADTFLGPEYHPAELIYSVKFSFNLFPTNSQLEHSMQMRASSRPFARYKA